MSKRRSADCAFCGGTFALDGFVLPGHNRRLLPEPCMGSYMHPMAASKAAAASAGGAADAEPKASAKGRYP